MERATATLTGPSIHSSNNQTVRTEPLARLAKKPQGRIDKAKGGYKAAPLRQYWTPARIALIAARETTLSTPDNGSGRPWLRRMAHRRLRLRAERPGEFGKPRSQCQIPRIDRGTIETQSENLSPETKSAKESMAAILSRTIHR